MQNGRTKLPKARFMRRTSQVQAICKKGAGVLGCGVRFGLKGRREVIAGRLIGPVFLRKGTGSLGVEQFCPAPAAELSQGG